MILNLESSIEVPEPQVIVFDMLPSDDRAIVNAQIAATLDSLEGSERDVQVIVNYHAVR